MAITDPSEKVLIIGAGLAGLVLAILLEKEKVPYEIYERDEGPHSRKQGWAVALVEAIPPLRKLLPEQLAKNLPSNSVNVTTGDHDEIAFVNARSGETVGILGGRPFEEPGSLLRVSREHFRDYLWQAPGLKVYTNKKFSHYVEDADGVTAHFTDGTSTRGSLLLGADGAHSRVLDQLIGKEKHKIVLSKLVPMFAEADVPPEIFEPLRNLGNAVILATRPGIHIQMGMISMKPDRSSAHYFWVVMPIEQDPQEMSDWVQKASKQELFDYMTKCTEDLCPQIRDLVEYGGPESVVEQTRFLEFEPPENLPRGRVSVLGDAAHAMIPFRGAGANTAILDACDLAYYLVQAKKEGRDLASVLPTYLEEMIPRGTENVRSSRAAGEMDENQWIKVFRERREAIVR